MSLANPQVMQFYGPWDNTHQYPFNTNEAFTSGPVVSYGGSLYIAIALPTIGHAPSVYPAEWSPLANGAGSAIASSFCNGVFSAGSPLSLTTTAAAIAMSSFTITKSTDVSTSGNNIVLPIGHIYNCILSVQADTFDAAKHEVQGYFSNVTASTTSVIASSMGFVTSSKGTQGIATFQVSTLAAAVTLNVFAGVLTTGTASITSGDQTWFNIYSL